MLILQIAGGIILAALILTFWRTFLAIVLWVGGGVILAVLVLALYYSGFNVPDIFGKIILVPTVIIMAAAVAAFFIYALLCFVAAFYAIYKDLRRIYRRLRPRPPTLDSVTTQEKQCA
jgi:hypothetical protein